MKFNQFRDIVAVAECGSLRKAAKRLNITQPTISRSIYEVERKLGVAIFERHAKGILVTEMGRAFVRRAKAVMAEISRAEQEIEQLKGRATGEVHVSMSTTAEVALMPSAIAAFRREYPDVMLTLSEHFFDMIETEVKSGQIDFYVGPVDPQSLSRDFSVELLFDNQRYIFGRKEHPLAGAKTLEELQDARWVKPTQSKYSVGDFGSEFIERGLSPPHEAVHARSILGALLAVATSDLLTQLPRIWLRYPPVASYIVAFEAIGPLRAMPICIVRRKDMPLTPLAERLSDLMRRAAGHYTHRGIVEAPHRGFPI